MELKTYFAQDAAGNIISSAIVNVFLQGTNTLATGLARADGTPLENPFAADGAGRIQFRAPDGYYDIQVSAGSGIIQTLTIQCVDYTGVKGDADRAEAAADRADVSAEQVADAVALRGEISDPEGAIKYPELQVARWRDIGDVRGWGAVGDGTNDDRVAIQDAVNQSSIVRIPPGTYLISDPGIMLPDGVRVIGSGKSKTILIKKASNGSDQLDPIFRERFIAGVANPARNITIEHIGFLGNGDPAVKTAKAAGLLRFYTSYNLRVIACSFGKGRGYGAGFEGALSSPLSDRKGPNEDAYFEDCDFYSNGKQEYLIGTDTDDGVDFKSSTRATFIKCRFWDNGDKGLDIRGVDAKVIGCISWQNAGAGFTSNIEGVTAGTTSITPADVTFIGCTAKGNGAGGFTIVPQVTPGVVAGLQRTRLIGCHSENNAHNYNVASRGTNDLAVSRIVMQGCTSRDPSTGNRHYIASDLVESLTISGSSFVGGNSSAIVVNAADVGATTITGNTFENISSNCVNGSANASATLTLTGNSFKSITGTALLGHSNCTVSGNTYSGVTASQLVTLSGTNNRVLDKAQNSRTVASASTITLPEISDLFTISGTVQIDNITPSWVQRIVILKFAGALTVKDGGNLLLSSDYVTTSNDTLTLVCDGTNWIEVARSAN